MLSGSPASDPEAVFQAAVRAGLRRNAAIIIGVHGCWGFGTALFSITAVMPLYLRSLGASDLVIGALPAIFTLCIGLPQLAAAFTTSHLALKKRLFACTHFPGGLGLLAMAGFAARSQSLSPNWVIAATLACNAVFALSLSFAAPMWYNLLAKLLPAERRGRYFGYIHLCGGLCGAAGALLARAVLARLPYPANYAALFGFAGVWMPLAVCAFFFLAEPPLPDAPPRPSARAFIAGLGRQLQMSRDFVRFLGARALIQMGLLGGAFYAVAAKHRIGIGDEVAGTFTASMLAAQVAAATIVGRVGDRWGFKVVMMLSPLFLTAASLLALVAGSTAAFSVAFALQGGGLTSLLLGSGNLIIEYCPTADKTTFMALAGALLAPVQAAAPLLGGWLAASTPIGYRGLFGIAGAVSLIGLVWLAFGVADPRTGSPRALGRQPMS